MVLHSYILGIYIAWRVGLGTFGQGIEESGDVLFGHSMGRLWRVINGGCSLALWLWLWLWLGKSGHWRRKSYRNNSWRAKDPAVVSHKVLFVGEEKEGGHVVLGALERTDVMGE